jgi:DNA topoisomerase-1
VVGLLEHHFSDLVDYGFTAAMEDDLDEIARGDQEGVPWLSRFYFGNGHVGLKELVSHNLGEIDAREVNSIPIGGPDSGVVVRVGRYGPYIQRGDDERAPIPEDLAPDELTVERAVQLLEAGSSDRVLGADPDSGQEVVVKAGRFGPYVQVGEAAEGDGRPRTASLFKSMDPASITLEDALRLLTLPRVVGIDPNDGREIVASNGRYGPYLKKDKDTRSLESEDRLFSVTLDEALALFAQPKARRGRAAQAAPLRELGTDPVSGAPIVLKEGRFGPYVTDGTTNASLRKGDSVEEMTPERAQELLADRRSAPPRAARGRKAAGATKKAGTKKTGTKKAAATKSGATKAGATKASTKKAGKKSASTRRTGS